MDKVDLDGGRCQTTSKRGYGQTNRINQQAASDNSR